MVFGNVRFNIVVRINHDNVASRGAVGRTHTIVRLETRIRQKDGTENFGGFVYVLDGFPQRDFVLWVFMCPINFILFCLDFSRVSLFRLPRRCLPRPIYIARAITPRAITPLPPLRGYHACVYIYPSCHAIFVVYHSPAITTRVLLHLHHQRGATRTNLLHNPCRGRWLY